MKNRKLYDIEIQGSDGEWRPQPCMQGVTREFARGWVMCSDAHYPSRPVRVVERETKKVILETKGRGEVKI